MNEHYTSLPVDLSTPSLTLSWLTAEDTAIVADVMCGPTATPLRERMGWSEPLSPDAVENYVRGYVRRWEQNECASYLVRETDSDDTVGVAFCYLDDDAELGLWLHPDFWGKGYGTEILDVLTTISRDADVETVWAETNENNEQAIRLLSSWAKRYGGSEVLLTDGCDPHHRFIIDS